MTGRVYRLCVLFTFLTDIYASWIVHSDSATWRDAVTVCMSHNQTLVNNIDQHLLQHLTSCVNKENITFWTGGYTGFHLTDWIAFHGCFNASQQIVNSHSESQAHTVSACKQFCGDQIFGLTISSCVCLRTFRQHSALQRHYNCIRNGDDYIGINGTIAIYKSTPDLAGSPNSWCSTYQCNGHSRYQSRRCNNKAHYKCVNGFTSNHAVTWNEAVLACVKKGSSLQGTIPERGCLNHFGYWSYVRRFREHKFATRETKLNANIKECEMACLREGSISIKRTPDCGRKKMSYICQSDDKSNDIYIPTQTGLKRCHFSAKVTYTSSSSNPLSLTKPSPSVISSSNGQRTMTHLETVMTGSTAHTVTTQRAVAIKGTISTITSYTSDILSSEFTLNSSTHPTNNLMNTGKDSQVGLIAGVVTAGVVVMITLVVILVLCRKGLRKNKQENESVSTSKQRFQKGSQSKDPRYSVKQREATPDETCNGDVELYDVSGEGEYDHLRSNNRRIKKEAESMYDTTAQVKAEEELYSSTKKGNSYVESSEFYDSMQQIKNYSDGIYDHSMTDSNYSPTAAPLYSTTQY